MVCCWMQLKMYLTLAFFRDKGVEGFEFDESLTSGGCIVEQN